MGGEGNEQMGVGQFGSVWMLRKSMAERKMRFFGHIIRKNKIVGEKIGAGEDGRQAAKGKTSNHGSMF